jgi:hypothetical protein
MPRRCSDGVLGVLLVERGEAGAQEARSDSAVIWYNARESIRDLGHLATETVVQYDAIRSELYQSLRRTVQFSRTDLFGGFQIHG